MRNKQLKQKKRTVVLHHLKSAPLLVVIGCLVAAAVGVPLAHADQFDTQIKALQQQNSQTLGTVSQLQSQASTYEDAIGKLQAQISGVQAAIQANEAKQADLQQQIQTAQAELDHEKLVLGEDIRAMYIDGKASTIEMLATSKNLSDFVDKQEYRSAVQNKLQATLLQITNLQNQLKAQQAQVVELLKTQKVQQAQLDADQQQQAQLLAYNQAQQAQYTQQIKDNQSKIAGLRAQQAAENAKLFAGANVVLGGACDTAHGDTYPTPWCNSAEDSLVDYWGMFNRECVSYTAWKVHESGRNMPFWGGIGNANQWDDNARAAGIPVDTSPRTGDVAIKNSMPYGHAMYVESVNGNGTINISQYNADLQGHFSRVFNMSPGGLVFVHFP